MVFVLREAHDQACKAKTRREMIDAFTDRMAAVMLDFAGHDESCAMIPFVAVLQELFGRANVFWSRASLVLA